MTASPAGRKGTQPRVAGRTTTWWGAVATIAVLSSMHSTLVFASLYYRQRATEWPPEGVVLPDLALPTALTALAVVSILPAAWAHTQVRSETAGRLQIGTIGTALLGLGILALAGVDLAAVEFTHGTHAFASVYWVLTGFHALVTLAGIAMFLFAPLQVWMAPLSSRNRMVVVSAAIVWYYVAAGWVVNYATLQLLPRWWSS